MNSKPLTISSSRLIALYGIVTLALYNFSFWAKLNAAYIPIASNWFFISALSTIVFLVYYLVLTLLSFKYVLKPFLGFLILGGAFCAYVMDTYGYVISAQTIQNVLETDSAEVRDLLSFKLALYLLLLGLIPTLLLAKLKIEYANVKQRGAYVLIALTLIAANLAIFNKSYVSFLRNQKVVRYYLNPLRPLYSLIKFSVVHIRATSVASYQILDPAPTLAAHTGKPRLVVLVVGESDRAANYSLNGYGRNTNPTLSLRPDVYSFTQFYSCGTETSVSVPCMFSAYTRTNFDYSKGRYTENALDLLQKSGVHVLWRDNDSGCKYVCDRVAIDDFNSAEIQPYCNGSECHDEVLLYQLQDRIDSKPGDKLIVLHKKGNHGPAYHKRYPAQFEHFTPICRSSELQDCSDQAIVNTYDNIVLYTDYFLSNLITQLEKNTDYQTAMIYVSDHGESLGEKGIYLHAMPYWLAPKEQVHIPFIFWASADFGLDAKLTKERLQILQAQEFSHDNLFHTLLGMFKVQTTAYKGELDLFKVR